MRDLSKFKGCLIGGAVGDALGYAVEFLSASTIFQKYGKNGITNYELHNGVAVCRLWRRVRPAPWTAH